MYLILMTFYQCFGSGFRGLLDPAQGLKKKSEMLNHNKIILLLQHFIFQLTSFDEIILYYFQIGLRNSLDPYSGVFQIRIAILGGIRIRVQ